MFWYFVQPFYSVLPFPTLRGRGRLWWLVFLFTLVPSLPWWCPWPRLTSLGRFLTWRLGPRTFRWPWRLSGSRSVRFTSPWSFIRGGGRSLTTRFFWRTWSFNWQLLRVKEQSKNFQNILEEIMCMNAHCSYKLKAWVFCYKFYELWYFPLTIMEATYAFFSCSSQLLLL